jgi:hypothetical protein
MLARNWLPSPSPFDAPRRGRRCRRTPRGGNGALRLHDARELVEPVVGDVDAPDVGILRGEGIVRREHAGGRERVEERGLADVRESDDTESEHYCDCELGVREAER